MQSLAVSLLSNRSQNGMAQRDTFHSSSGCFACATQRPLLFEATPFPFKGREGQ